MKIIKNRNIKVILLAMLMFSSIQSYGQSAEGDSIPYQMMIVLGFAFVVVVVVLMVAVMMLKVLNTMVRDQAIR